ncbi:17138_t:CDS:1 [Gigaspora margarita]|uniref:17138_t:CDS:1 n=1 Tax=Gigaspora margarita TaxID=4874 RepID=A0ABN7V8H1_GIGMA|nr:17138_t:CDS:1 [Gigaspora margarita]
MRTQNTPNSFYENSFNNEFVGNSPYELTLDIDELISPSPNTRKAEKHRKNQSSPPRPLNKFMLYRRDFIAKQKKNGIKMDIKDMTRWASYEWGNLTDEVHRYFEILEQMAKEKHRQTYAGYTYCPKKNKGKNSKSQNTGRQNTKTGQFSIIQFEKTNQNAPEPSEPTPETSVAESINVVTEQSPSEPPNLGFLNYEEWFLFDSSTRLLPIDIQEYLGINNFEQGTSTSFYHENFNGYGCYDQQPNINF